METSSSHPECNTTVHSNLSQWIIHHGGRINKSLALCSPEDAQSTSGSTSNEASNTTSYSQRGIYAKHGSISKGEELIRLPARLALDGAHLPIEYGNLQNASPWLRCLASLIHSWHLERYSNFHRPVDTADGGHAQQSSEIPKFWHSSDRISYGPYLASLPRTYDSLLNWSSFEIRSFLAGTLLGTMTLSGTDAPTGGEVGTHSQEDRREMSMRNRYQTAVVPYLNHLEHLGFFPKEQNQESLHEPNEHVGDTFDRKSTFKRRKTDEVRDGRGDDEQCCYTLFRTGCMCLSTRAFHMQATSMGGADESLEYQGPFLLPYIDLLNHAPNSSPKHATTLRRDPTDDSFVMIAERDIGMGQEICHSYDSGHVEIDDEAKSAGDSLTSAQFLQTFGFVDAGTALERLSLCIENEKVGSANKNSAPPEHHSLNLTPAIFLKDHPCRICRRVSLSSYPASLRHVMDESGLAHDGWEYWDMRSKEELNRLGSSMSTMLEGISEELIVAYDTPLSEELITTCCLHFVTEDVIEELCDPSRPMLLGEEALEDFFLGKLVLHSIVRAVDEKLKTYRVRLDDSELSFDALLEVMNLDSVPNGEPFCWGANVERDLGILSKLVSSELPQGQNELLVDLVDKFKCGMTISLEERLCLLRLKRVAMEKLVDLDNY